MTAAVTMSEAWPEGSRVERLVAEPVRGVVLFCEGEWVYWRGEDRYVHASRPSALRRIR